MESNCLSLDEVCGHKINLQNADVWPQLFRPPTRLAGKNPEVKINTSELGRFVSQLKIPMRDRPDQRHRKSWGVYILDHVTFQGPNASFWWARSCTFDGPQNWYSTHICPESFPCTVLENTKKKSGTRFILGSLYHFWSNRCDFRRVRHIVRLRILIRWQALEKLHDWY